MIVLKTILKKENNKLMKHYCKKCGKCCISSNLKGVIIFPSDMKRISDGLGISSLEFANRYCIKDYIEYNVEIYFLKNKDERCMFLSTENLCMIHRFKPIQCKRAPLNYFSNKNVWSNMPCLDNILIDEEYSKNNDRLLVNELLNGYHF